MNTIIVFASNTGNTEIMAKAIYESALEAGADAVLENVAATSTDKVLTAEVIALGSPAMGAEVLDDAMEELFSALEPSLAGKKVALFGSYDWGDGQWMRDWEDRVRAAGAELIGGRGLTAHLEPSDSDLAECKSLGTKLV